MSQSVVGLTVVSVYDIKLTFCRYSVMEKCWKFSPDERPGFEKLLETFDLLLQTVAHKVSEFGNASL